MLELDDGLDVFAIVFAMVQKSNRFQVADGYACPHGADLVNAYGSGACPTMVEAVKTVAISRWNSAKLSCYTQ